MIIVSAHNLHKRYGPQVVLAGASLNLRRGEKVGFIGPNGCGKTTLLRILAGQVEPDEGHVGIQREVRVAYLPQVPALPAEGTVAEAARESLAPLLEVERQAHAILDRISDTDDEAERRRLLHRHDELVEHFRRSGGYEIDRRVEEVLTGVGFGERLRAAPVGTLSGGEQSRLALARLLLGAPDVMLLDEPTNHLDIQATEWLEDFLAGYDGAALIVSHDRYLLDRTVTRIIEMRAGRAYSYKGTYTDYETQREEEVRAQWKTYRKQQAHVAHELDFIARYHAGQRGREARGRARKLARLERVDRPPADPKAPILSLKPDVRGGEIVCEFNHVAKAFGQRTLFKDLTFTLSRLDRLAILGPNGAGKTTILRLILGAEQPTAGAVRLGHNIQLGYADQEQSGIDPAKSIIEEVWQARPALTEGQMRGYLARFLFTGEGVFDRISTLSGGERARVALAKVMLTGPNCLLLDEPTNHLDVYAREALEEALLDYGGTVVVVSHDRYFLNRVARTILYVADGEARLYLGDYDFFHEQRLKERAAAKAPPPPPAAASRRRDRGRKRRPIYATSIEELEKRIMAKETELQALGQQLGDVTTYRDPDRARALQADYDRAAAQLDALNADWETRIEELDGP